jgi:release factor glutamine methyltransferase
VRNRGRGSLLDDAACRLRDAGIDAPRFEAGLLLARALRVARLDVLTESAAARRRATPAALRRFRALLARRARRVPLPYLTGETEFYGRPFRVTPAVLVPRPETETLVRCVLERLRCGRGLQAPICPFRVLDLGTGSGAIAVTVACECPGAKVVATDRSRAALAVARANARRLGVAGRIRFLAGDLFEALQVRGAFGSRPAGHRCRGPKAAPTTPFPAPAFHLVLSNPPYVSTSDLAACMPEVRDHEPRLATWGGRDGLTVIRRLVAEAPAFLVPGGALMLEVGAGQAGRVVRLLKATCRYESIAVTKDLAGIGRVVEGIKSI